MIGALVGAIGAGTLLLFATILPIGISVIFALLAIILVTGALHEDGLADTADGLCGGHTPERRLEIMRDSRVGTYGVVTLWAVMTLKWTTLTSIYTISLWPLAVGLILANGFGRLGAALVASLSISPPHMQSSKSGRFVGEISPLAMLPFGVPLFAATYFCFPWQCALTITIAVPTVTILTIPWFKKRLGGVTGDCPGAVSQAVELVVYLSMAAWVNYASGAYPFTYFQF